MKSPRLGVMVVSVIVTATPVAIQAQRAAEVKSKTTGTARTAPLRTADGRPDLQGVWSFATITPLERPTALTGKTVLSDAEAAAQEQEAAQRNVDRAPKQGDTGAYNRFWLDYGTKVVGTRRTSLVSDPPDGRIPPLTPEAQRMEAARVNAFDRAENPEDRDLSERCIAGFNAGPPMVPSAYNNNMQLFQTRDYVVILNEMVHNARIIPLDGRPHLPPRLRQWSGDSRGRWDGETLIIDTTNFSEKTHGAPVGALRGYAGHLTLVERFKRLDADTLLYEFTDRQSRRLHATMDSRGADDPDGRAAVPSTRATKVTTAWPASWPVLALRRKPPKKPRPGRRNSPAVDASHFSDRPARPRDGCVPLPFKPSVIVRMLPGI